MIGDRLRRAASAIAHLEEDDFDDFPARLRERVAAVKVSLAKHRFLGDPPGQVTDDVGERLAKEFLAILMTLCDPDHVGKVMSKSEAD